MHDAQELHQQLHSLARLRRTSRPREVLTGRAPDHAIEASTWSGECANIAAKQQIGATHHTKALLLESTAEKVYAWKNRQYQL